MNILGIENRTENWKTAYHFSPFFRYEGARLRLAKKLIANHEGKQPSDVELGEGNVGINLFWVGMRDYMHKFNKIQNNRVQDVDIIQDLAERYRCLFSDLRTKVCGFQHLRLSHPNNYDPFVGVNKVKLVNNLVHTEIDIVLETPNHVLIGEAKHETGFDNADTSYVLVHQLIRQYVTTKVLLDLLEIEKSEKKVVQFVVADNKDAAMNFGQVRFLIAQDWMNKDNVLIWEHIKELWP